MGRKKTYKTRAYYRGDELLFMGTDEQAIEFFGGKKNSSMPVYLCTPTNQGKIERSPNGYKKRLTAVVI